MTDAEAFLAKLKGDLAAFNTDLATAAKMYANPARQPEAIARQLFAVISLVEPWVKPPATLGPLWEHFQEIIEPLSNRRRGHSGKAPIRIADVMRRSLALALMEFEFRARGNRGEKEAAEAAAAAFPPYTASQLVNLRKRTNSDRERRLQEVRDRVLAGLDKKHQGDPAKAAEYLKNLAQEKQKVYWEA
jgi:hypothetical protein